MKSSFRYMAAAQKEVIGENFMENMMQIAFSVGKDGEVHICFGDSVRTEEADLTHELTESAFPNQGEALLSMQGLWLSMFTRHMDKLSVLEIELDE